MTNEDFQKKISFAAGKVDLADRLKMERRNAVKQRNESLKVVWDLTKRIRNAAKATSGDSSKKIEIIGGNISCKLKYLLSSLLQL